MTPQQIASAIIATRSTMPPPSAHAPDVVAFRLADIQTMIVDGIERALAQQSTSTATALTLPDDHIDRMRVSRRVAEWEIGDGDWAAVIVGAYLNPQGASERLAEEQHEPEEEPDR